MMENRSFPISKVNSYLNGGGTGGSRGIKKIR